MYEKGTDVQEADTDPVLLFKKIGNSLRHSLKFTTDTYAAMSFLLACTDLKNRNNMTRYLWLKCCVVF